jgi:hypothetical protein
MKQTTKAKESVITMLRNVTHRDIVKFEVLEIVDALKSLKCGKSAGLDHLQGEHFKFADTTISCLLCMLFNAVIIHGYLPSKLMETIIIPLVKDKKGLITDKDNYRPVAITCVASKLLELLILGHIKDYLNTECNQFGFKAKHGTDMCVFVLKQIIDFYML